MWLQCVCVYIYTHTHRDLIYSYLQILIQKAYRIKHYVCITENNGNTGNEDGQ